MSFHKYPQKKQWRGFTKRKIYYISTSGQQGVVAEDVARKYKKLLVYRGGALPVLACLVVDERFSPASFGSAGCPLAAGGVYPYDKTKIGALRLSYGNKAIMARLILLFHQRGGKIRVLNTNKLYKVISATSFFIDSDVFFRSLARNKLSRYSIKKQKFFTVPVPVEARTWLRSWIPVSYKGFSLVQERAQIPMGAWIFLNPHNNDYAVITMSAHGSAMFSLHQ